MKTVRPVPSSFSHARSFLLVHFHFSFHRVLFFPVPFTKVPTYAYLEVRKAEVRRKKKVFFWHRIEKFYILRKRKSDIRRHYITYVIYRHAEKRKIPSHAYARSFGHFLMICERLSGSVLHASTFAINKSTK